jgi:hypothetical protein
MKHDRVSIGGYGHGLGKMSNPRSEDLLGTRHVNGIMKSTHPRRIVPASRSQNVS